MSGKKEKKKQNESIKWCGFDTILYTITAFELMYMYMK